MIAIRRKHKLNSKGFSLVELIIVIAIMAVLIAVLAPQFIRYIEKAKRGKDMEVAGVVQKAINVAMADPSINDRPVSFGPAPLANIDTSTMTDFAGAVKEYIGTNNLSAFNLDNIKSNTYGGQDIIVEINASTELVRVRVYSNNPDVEDIVIE